MNEPTNPNPLTAPHQANDNPAPAATVAQPSPAASSSTVPVRVDCAIEIKTKPARARRRTIRRKGRIASLPKLQRDMVNRMLANGIPYKNIVAALANADFTVNERNISNWARGGYLEWSLAQEQLSTQRFDQDHMLDFLRRDDAAELPEVGLQAAATRLSQILLQKLSRAEDPQTDLENYSKLVNLLVRLNREIAANQTQRDDAQRAADFYHDPTRVKNFDQLSAIETERYFSGPPPDSGLSAPRVAPILPPLPSSTLLKNKNREENLKRLKAFLSRGTTAAEQTRRHRRSQQ
jgi:hypothetical protein